MLSCFHTYPASICANAGRVRLSSSLATSLCDSTSPTSHRFANYTHVRQSTAQMGQMRGVVAGKSHRARETCRTMCSSVGSWDEPSPLSWEGDYIVIGAGIMGSTTAYQLAKRGHSVCLVEQFDFGHKLGSSHGESRIIRKTYPQAWYANLMPESYDLWGEAERESDTRVFTKTGGLYWGPNTSSTWPALISTNDEAGVEYELLNPEEAASRWPCLKPVPGYQALYTPDTGIINASKALAMFQSLARNKGACLVDRTPVESISVDEEGSKVHVSTATGWHLKASRCVVTAGPWAKKLLKGVFDFELALEPIHTSISYWACERPEELSVGNFPCMITIHDDDRSFYSTPVLEYPGMWKLSKHSGPPVDPDKRQVAPEQLGADELADVKQYIEDHMLGVSTTPSMVAGCMYTMAPDEDFMLDTLPGSHGRIVVGAGFSGHGFKLGPIVGRILADMAEGKEPANADMSKFKIKSSSEFPKGHHLPNVNYKSSNAQSQGLRLEV